jgi:hypothetical protein
MEKWPFTQQVIPTPGGLGPPLINPMPSMPAEQFGRGIDPPAGDSPPGGGGGGTAGDWPMKLVAVDDENVKVLLATVNGITPTDINTSIDVSGTNSTWAIYLHATLGADGIPTAVEVLSDDTNTIPSDDADNAYLKIGEVDVAAAVITEVRPSLAWSQTFVACGRDPADPTTTPGTFYWVVA